MKVVLVRGLHIDKHFYPAGEQDIAVEKLKTKTFAKHIKAGHILEPSAAPRRSVAPTPEARAKVLMEKVYGKDKQDASPEEAEGLSGGVASEAPADQASTDEAAPQAKSGKKNR